jgi:hypothetical protein
MNKSVQLLSHTIRCSLPASTPRNSNGGEWTATIAIWDTRATLVPVLCGKKMWVGLQPDFFEMK